MSQMLTPTPAPVVGAEAREGAKDDGEQDTVCKTRIHEVARSALEAARERDKQADAMAEVEVDWPYVEVTAGLTKSGKERREVANYWIPTPSEMRGPNEVAHEAMGLALIASMVRNRRLPTRTQVDARVEIPERTALAMAVMRADEQRRQAETSKEHKVGSAILTATAWRNKQPETAETCAELDDTLAELAAKGENGLEVFTKDMREVTRTRATCVYRGAGHNRD